MLDKVALAETGRSWGLTGQDLGPALDPLAIVESRTGLGGAASDSVEAMVEQCTELVGALDHDVSRRRRALARAERDLLERARRLAGLEDVS